MRKPQERVSGPYYDYFECRDYIEHKYNLDKSALCRFWNVLCVFKEVTNGTFFYLYEDDVSLDEEQKQILNLLFKEFGSGRNSLYFNVSW